MKKKPYVRTLQWPLVLYACSYIILLAVPHRLSFRLYATEAHFCSWTDGVRLFLQTILVPMCFLVPLYPAVKAASSVPGQSGFGQDMLY